MSISGQFSERVEAGFEAFETYKGYVSDAKSYDGTSEQKLHRKKRYKRVNIDRPYQLILGPTAPGARPRSESGLSRFDPIGHELTLFIRWIATNCSGISPNDIKVIPISDAREKKKRNMSGFLSVLSVQTSREDARKRDILIVYDSELLIRKVVGKELYDKLRDRSVKNNQPLHEEFLSSKLYDHFGVFRSVLVKMVLHELAHVVMHLQSWTTKQLQPNETATNANAQTLLSDKVEEREAWHCCLLWWAIVIGDLAHSHRADGAVGESESQGRDDAWRVC